MNEATLKAIIGDAVTAIEAFAALIISLGAIEAAIRVMYLIVTDRRGPLVREKETWLRFGVWLLFGLEFQLAADILRTIIAPTWTELGQVGAIALLRTALNAILERDLERYGMGPGKKTADNGGEGDKSQKPAW